MKPVPFNLQDQDGNAFMLLAGFRKAAKKAGWSQSDIDRLTSDATSGDYDHLLQVLIAHCA